MANQTCTQRLKVCHLRILRLGPDGAVVSGADSRYESDAPILFNFTPQSRERDQHEQVNGCGDLCASYTGPPGAPTGVDFSLQLCNSDAEVQELLVGGELITDYQTGDTIGYCAPTDETVNQNGVAIELWAMQWQGKQRALYQGAPAWYRFVFPKATFQFGAQQLANEFGVTELTGHGEVNSGFGFGLDDDPWATPVGDAPWCWVIDPSKPEAECGYLSVAA